MNLNIKSLPTGGYCLSEDSPLPCGTVRITDSTGQALPANVETDLLTITIQPHGSTDPVVHRVQGRTGLNDWYEENVGYRPDVDEFQADPMALLSNVAEMMYRHATGDAS